MYRPGAAWNPGRFVCRPFRAGRRADVFLGLKPKAESCSPFGTKFHESRGARFGSFDTVSLGSKNKACIADRLYRSLRDHFRFRKSRQLSEKVFQDEALIDRVIEPDRPILSGVYVVHLTVKFRRWNPIIAAAVLVHHYPNGG